MAEKSDNATVDQRVNEVLELIIGGASSRRIVQYGSEKWSISERQVWDYIKKANGQLRKVAEKNAERDLGLALARLSKLFAQTMTIRDYRTALSVQKEINALLGLYPPAELKHSGDGPDGAIIFQVTGLPSGDSDSD